MARIGFGENHAKDDDDTKLIEELADYFNRKDVNDKMVMVAQEIFPKDSTMMAGFTLDAVMLKAFLTGNAECDPHNLSAAIVNTAFTNEDKKLLSAERTQDLNDVAKGLITLVQDKQGELAGLIQKRAGLALGGHAGRTDHRDTSSKDQQR